MSSDDPPPADLYSPLAAILAEEELRESQTVEALLLTFNIDYGFFERTILGPLQATGARITTIADALISAPDPRAARRAGISYLPGLALVPGAFHPKVTVLAGPSRSTVMIGSGNVSIGGWQYNAETLVVAHGTGDSHPDWFPDLADWLNGLPARVRMAPRSADGCRRTARILHAMIELGTPSDTRQRLLHNSDTPILDQLPSGPVDELRLSAPFHDPDARAIAALIDRMQPATTRIAMQPGLTVTDTERLFALADQRNVQIVRDSLDDRYRHGKVVEWTIGDRTWSLAGSPNLSVSALCRTATQRNCEIALLTQLADGSLFPPVDDLLTRETAGPAVTISSDGDQHTAPQPVLLAATLETDGLHVSLARPWDSPLHIEASPFEWSPDNWQNLGSVPTATGDWTLTTTLTGGSRVRVRSDPTPEHPAATSNVVFLVDPSSVTRRISLFTGGPRTSRPQVAELFDDYVAAAGFLTEMEALATGLAATTMPSPTSSPGSESHPAESQHRLDADDYGWLTYLEGSAERLGPDLLAFALPPPDLPDLGSSDSVRDVTWDDLLADDDIVGLDEDTAESQDDQDAAPEPRGDDQPPDLHNAPADVKRRFRRWAHRLSELTDRLPPMERLAAVRLLLWTTRSGIWDSRNPDDWYVALASATQALAKHEPPERLRAATASLAAVATTVLYEHTAFDVSTDRTQKYEETVNTVTELLLYTDDVLVTAYSEHLHNRYGGPLTPDTVLEVVEHICDGDPFTNLIDHVRLLGWDAERVADRALLVEGPFSNPVLPAHRILGLAEDLGPVGVWTISAQGTWCFAAWQQPHLIRVERGRTGPIWRHYRLDRLVGPAALAMQMTSDTNASRDYEVDHIPRNQAFPEAIALLAALGLSTAEPPAR